MLAEVGGYRSTICSLTPGSFASTSSEYNLVVGRLVRSFDTMGVGPNKGVAPASKPSGLVLMLPSDSGLSSNLLVGTLLDCDLFPLTVLPKLQEPEDHQRYPAIFLGPLVL